MRHAGSAFAPFAVAVCGFLAAPVGWAAQPAAASVVYTLPGARSLCSRLLLGPDGALYGCYSNGETSRTLFRLAPPASGTGPWSETDLASVWPNSYTTLGLVDGAGNLYGVTQAPTGAHDSQVFRLAPPTVGSTTWTFTVLHTAARGDGISHVLSANRGILYGTFESGRYPDATGGVFALRPPATGSTSWRYSVIRTFAHQIFDGVLPRTVDGTLTLFGVDDAATLFSLTAPTSFGGGWAYRSLGVKGGVDLPFAADRQLDLYGASGSVLRLRPPAAGQSAWTSDVLNSGSEIGGPLVEDNRSNLYGKSKGYDVAKVTPRDQGGVTLPWNASIIHHFPAGSAVWTPFTLTYAPSGDALLYVGVDNTVYRLSVAR